MNASLIAVNTVGGVGLCRPSAERVKKIGSKSVDRGESQDSHQHHQHHEDSQYQSEERLAWPGSLTDTEGSRQIPEGADWALYITAGSWGACHQVRAEEGGQDSDDQ